MRAWQPLLDNSLPWKCSIERGSDSGTPQYKTGYRNETMPSYQFKSINIWKLWWDHTSPAWIRYQYWSPSPSVMIWTIIGQTARTSMVRMDSDLNANRYISYILRRVVLPYFRGLPKPVFQQNNTRTHFVHRVLMFLYPQAIGLSPGLHIFRSDTRWKHLVMATERLDYHLSWSNTVGKVWQRLEAAWNELPVSVTEVPFDYLSNQEGPF